MEVEKDEEEIDDNDEEEEEDDEPNDPTTNSTVPLVYPSMSYTGHQNSQTVKSVNFIFNGSYCISGSDDGNFFLWSLRDTEPATTPPVENQENENESRSKIRSGKLVGIYYGDSNTVNVMKPHPFLPIIAISGIDTDIKLFSPFVDSSPPPASAAVVVPSGVDTVEDGERMESGGGVAGVGDGVPPTREIPLGQNANLLADQDIITRRNQGGGRMNRLRGMMVRRHLVRRERSLIVFVDGSADSSFPVDARGPSLESRRYESSHAHCRSAGGRGVYHFVIL